MGQQWLMRMGVPEDRPPLAKSILEWHHWHVSTKPMNGKVGRGHVLQVMARNELVLISLLFVTLILVTAFVPDSVFRLVLGVPALIFFPGYSFLAALFPGKEPIDGIERIALSFGMSIALVPMIVFVIDAVPWLTITLEPVLYTISALVLVATSVAWWQRERTPARERFTPDLKFWTPLVSGIGRHRTLYTILAVVCAGMIGTIGYVVAQPPSREKFTDFYMLSIDETVMEYPTQIRRGEQVELILGVINRRHEAIDYRVETRIDGTTNGILILPTLQHEEWWEEVVSFAVDEVGEGKNVEFVLFKDDETEPLLKPLQLWVDVTE